MRPPAELPARQQLFLLASALFLACSVDLAPEERDPPAGSGGGGGGGGMSKGGFSGGGSGGSPQGGGGLGATGGSGGFGAGGSGGFGAGGSGGFGAGGSGGLGAGGAGGVGNVSGGGTGNTGADPGCANVFAIDGDLDGTPGGCSLPDPQACMCHDCYAPICSDANGFYADCVCPVCWADEFCGPTFCYNDGLCDPFNEGCACNDCFLHWACTDY